MKINATKTANLIHFREPTGSSFIVDSSALCGARLYSYNDKKTNTTKWAIKLFFDMVGQEPIVYNGYETETAAVEELNFVIEMMG